MMDHATTTHPPHPALPSPCSLPSGIIGARMSPFPSPFSSIRHGFWGLPVLSYYRSTWAMCRCVKWMDIDADGCMLVCRVRGFMSMFVHDSLYVAMFSSRERYAFTAYVIVTYFSSPSASSLVLDRSHVHPPTLPPSFSPSVPPSGIPPFPPLDPASLERHLLVHFCPDLVSAPHHFLLPRKRFFYPSGPIPGRLERPNSHGILRGGGPCRLRCLFTRTALYIGRG